LIDQGTPSHSDPFRGANAYADAKGTRPTMMCPYLVYRRSDGDRSFDRERPYCTAADRFVQPMRADICRSRFDLEPAEHCEIYRAAEDLEDA
jgi:hypothetical protein